MKLRIEIEVIVDEKRLLAGGASSINPAVYIRSLKKELDATIEGYTFIWTPTPGFKFTEQVEVI